jgi:protein phosphatase 1G
LEHSLCRFGLQCTWQFADQAVALSIDHKPMSTDERDRIEAAGGTVNEVGGVARVNGNLNLSRAIGDLKYKTNERLPPEKQVITAHPDVRIFELTREDRFFILACDGVWDVLTNQV